MGIIPLSEIHENVPDEEGGKGKGEGKQRKGKLYPAHLNDIRSNWSKNKKNSATIKGKLVYPWVR